MAVSPFCMLKKCRRPDTIASDHDRCPHPAEWCDCSCHGLDPDDAPELDAVPAPPERSPIPPASPSFRTTPIPPLKIPTIPPLMQTEPCPFGACPRHVNLKGPGRASHLRWHESRGDHLRTIEGATMTVTTEPVRPVPEPDPGKSVGVDDTLRRARAEIVAHLARIHQEAVRLEVARDALDGILGVSEDPPG